MSSRIRLFHACPCNQPFDCFCGTKPICQNINYCGCTEYCEIDYGSHSIIICPPRNQFQQLVNAYTYLPDACCHTAIATGSRDDMSLFVVPDANVSYSPGKAFIRFVNLAYDTSCLDFRFTDGAFFIANNIQYKEVTQYYPVTPSTYRMQAMLCNTNHVVLTVPSVTLQAGRSYTLYITGSVYQPPYCSHSICMDGLYSGSAQQQPSIQPSASLTPSYTYQDPWFPTPSLPPSNDYYPDNCGCSSGPNYYPDYSYGCPSTPNYYPDYGCGCASSSNYYYSDNSCDHSGYPSAGCQSYGTPYSGDTVTYGSSHTHYYTDNCCTRNQPEEPSEDENP